PVAVDDVKIAGPCSGENVPKYPTVTIGVGATQSEPVQVHFDTGSPITLFDFEFVEQRGLAPTDPNWETLSRQHASTNDEEDWDLFEFLKRDTILYDQQTMATTTVRLKGLAVSDWKRTSLAKRCAENCPLYKKRVASYCAHRPGIVGRDFLLVNHDSQ